MDILGIIKYGIAKVISVVVNLVVAILPTSPFQAYLNYFSEFEYLPYINYFLPIDTFIVIFEAWLAGVALWYVYCFIMDVIGWVSGYGSGGVPSIK